MSEGGWGRFEGGEQASQGLLKVEEERWPVKTQRQQELQAKVKLAGELEEAQWEVLPAPGPGFLGQLQVPYLRAAAPRSACMGSDRVKAITCSRSATQMGSRKCGAELPV